MSGSAPRVALFWAPGREDPLAALGAAWLGRDAEDGAPRAQPPVPGLAELTAEARRYGLHATLKPPMRLRPGTSWNTMVLAAERLAACAAPFPLPPLAVVEMDGFLTLRETAPSTALQALADLCVAGLEPWREPPDAAELARRRAGGLSPGAEARLLAWGYPHVFAGWRFHVTLSRRLDRAEAARLLPVAREWFAPALAWERRVTEVCLFTEVRAGADLLLAERVRLGG